MDATQEETSFIESSDSSTGLLLINPTYSQDAEVDGSSSTESETGVNNANCPQSKYHLIGEALVFISPNYIRNMLSAVRNLAVSVIVIGFLTILIRTHIPTGLCPVVYYVIMGYWAWLSVLIIGGQILHLCFYR